MKEPDSWNKAMYFIEAKNELVAKYIQFLYDRSTGCIHIGTVIPCDEVKSFSRIQTGDIVLAINSHFFVSSPKVGALINTIGTFISEKSTVYLILLSKRLLEQTEQRALEQSVLIKHSAGMDLCKDVTGDFVIIYHIVKNGAAETARNVHPGHVLLGVNDTNLVGVDLDSVRGILAQSFPPRTILLGLPHLLIDYDRDAISIYQRSHMKEEKLGENAVGVDMYMFTQSEAYLSAEEQYKESKEEQWKQRDKEWTILLNKIGGVDQLNYSWTRACGKRWESLAITEYAKNRRQLRKLLRLGCPYQLRSDVWFYLSGAAELKAKSPRGFDELYKDMNDQKIMQEIEQDINRTFPNHPFFNSEGSPIREKLYNVLYAIAVVRTDIGYCQGMNYLAGALLLTTNDAERSFWILYALFDHMFDQDYFSEALTGAQVDQGILEDLVTKQMPALGAKIKQYGFSLRVFTLQWFICLYVNTVPMETAMRIWDVIFMEGDKAMIRIGLALLSLGEEHLLRSDDIGSFYNGLKRLGTMLFDADELFNVAYQDEQAEGSGKMVVKFKRADIARWRKEKRAEIAEERRKNEDDNKSHREIVGVEEIMKEDE
ncbi:hypothetical protein WA158_004136 [Blastocystis sp. Blastoise]